MFGTEMCLWFKRLASSSAECITCLHSSENGRVALLAICSWKAGFASISLRTDSNETGEPEAVSGETTAISCWTGVRVSICTWIDSINSGGLMSRATNALVFSHDAKQQVLGLNHG